MNPDWTADELALIDRYLAGKCAPEERGRAEALLAREPESAARYRAAVEVLRDAPSAPEAQAMLRQYRARFEGFGEGMPSFGIAARATTATWLGNGRRQGGVGFGRRTLRGSSRYGSAHYGSRLWVTGLGVAALMISLVGLGHHPFLHRNKGASQQIVRTNVREWKTIHLFDEATVRLAPASTLRVPSNMATSQDAIELDGEAYFEVRAHSDLPFIVRTRGAQARVFGTAFSVRRYADERSTQLIVLDGKVSFSPSRSGVVHPGVVLAARMLGVIDDSGHVTVTPNITVEDYTAWTHGTLVFRQTPVRNIVAELSRAYGADIRLADSTLGRREFTWTIPVNRVSLDAALKVLTSLIHAHVTQSGNTITIAPGTSTSRNADVPDLSSSPESRYGL